MMSSIIGNILLFNNQSSSNGGEQVSFRIPSTFSDFVDNITRPVDSQLYSTSYNFNTIPSAITGTACYIDLENGNNANPGTESQPFKTMAFAHSTSHNIFYVRGRGDATSSAFGITRSIKILKWGDNPVELTTSVALTFSQNGTFPTVYQASNPSAPTFISSVFDRSVLSPEGVYTGYSRQTSLAAVNSNAGSFWYDSANTTLYVKTPDSRVPDSNVVACLGAPNILNSTGTLSVTRHLYIEGIMFLGGGICVNLANVGAGTLNFGFKDCEFSHANGTEAAVYMAGAHLRGFINNCKSYFNRDDAFDYNSADAFVFEWYCSGGRNTWGGTSCNGSTAHSASKVIRVGSIYQYTAGKPVQDINDTRTYSLGCTAGFALPGDPNNYAYASNGSTGTTQMWLIECKQTGPAGRGYHNFNNSTINLFDGDFGNLSSATNRNDVGSVLNNLTEGDVYL